MTLTITPPSNVGCESIAVITLSIFLNVKLYGDEKTRRTRLSATAAKREKKLESCQIGRSRKDTLTANFSAIFTEPWIC